MSRTLGVWFPAIRARSGADVFTERLCAAHGAMRTYAQSRFGD